MENNGKPDGFVPFTKAERMQQLSEIDRNIVSLLRSTAAAVQTLGKQQPEGEDTTMTDDKDQQQDVFQDSMNDFLRTLRTVNVGVKRQIWGLEEAHIISVDSNGPQGTKEEGGEVQGAGRSNAPIKPDGNGKIGGLDVGWLNSRSDRVERGIEADLWDEAELLLQRLLQKGDANQTTNGNHG
ncbi:mediator complex, subunit Med11 [Hypoxylon crocopeplum]|nr:mediator complex, subunit Med11 [Hypoxylon crocopeplum]